MDKTEKLYSQTNVFKGNTYIEDGTVIGENNVFSNNCTIYSNCVIGNNNYFAPGTVLGAVPRERFQGSHKSKTFAEKPLIRIGDNNIFEANVVVQEPLESETVIGNNVCIGSLTYIAHDVMIEDNVTIAGNCAIAGYCILMERANIGIGACLHQRTVIGTLAMVGAGCVVIKHVSPFATVIGVPARFIKINNIGMIRSNMTEKEIYIIESFLEKKDIKEVGDSIKSVFSRFLQLIDVWQRNKGIVPEINMELL